MDSEKKKRLAELRDSMKAYGYSDGVEELESIFPELRESKDERIRREILETLHYGLACEESVLMPGATTTLKEAIAYLERQKEQIVIKQNIIDSIRANTQPDWDFSTIPNLHKEISRFFGEKFILPHTEDTIITVSDVIRCAYHFYKFGQQEQKPAEWSEDTIRKAIEEVGLTQHQINWFKNNVFPPKQEWSEEDEKMLWGFTAWIPEEELAKHNITRNDILEKLKSLRPQPKQKWSQDDNDFADDAIACVRRCHEKYIDNKEFYQSLRHNTMDIIRWLIKVRKRLTPQWKPSEEQMAALHYAKDGIPSDCTLLTSLYNDLKML